MKNDVQLCECVVALRKTFTVVGLLTVGHYQWILTYHASAAAVLVLLWL
jgi:hypothetical protein